MEQKKYLGMSILVSVVITFFWCIIVSFMFTKSSVIPTITQTPVVQLSDDFQQKVLTSLSGVLSSTVSISANTDIKAYVDDPSQIQWPTTVSGQVKLGGASGILVSKDGYVLTNKHAVENLKAHYQVRLVDGRTYMADKLWLDPVLDLAVLRVIDEKGDSPDDLPVATLLPFDQFASVGQFVLAIGNALDEYPNTVTFGILSAQQKLLTVNQKNIYTKLYQTDAHVSPWNSWWPLVDLDGHVIGLVSAVDEMQGMTFALPLSSALIDALLHYIIQYGSIIKPLLGIEYLDITSTIQTQKKLSTDVGVLVTSVLSDMPASEAGLKNGDILTAIDNKPLNTSFPLLYHLYTYLPNDTITFTVMRGDQILEIPVKLWQNGN